ncbi:beta-galactosidase GalB [Stakelama saccharophila]|uniref:Beta-galactosidase GalB n=1 Tax=Stakelama saccharophila TaxID=3075605 RepID=A0ABZ0B6M5_9SPHN|nr:beta-galactosidase GalB [Stakelama sp. W311]WNO52892.1 beta-galactosidase GalB [Stakelama sp. W311]
MFDPRSADRRSVLKASAAMTLPLSGTTTAGGVWATTRADDRAIPRKRRRLDAGWRFRRGDAGETGDGRSLIYDARSELPDTEDIDLSLSPVRIEGENQFRLKPWILPAANAFIADPAARHPVPTRQPDIALPFARSDHDDSGWDAVRVPHDWAIAGPFLEEGDVGGMGRLPSWGVGWYRRRLDIPAGDAGKSVFLDIDGAMAYAAVWLNGELVGGWPYGYNGWRLDLTPYVRPGGINQLAIRLANPPESARWYPGGGLYRNVWLVTVDPVHVGHWGTQITTTDVSDRRATVDCTVTIDNDGEEAADAAVATEIFALSRAGARAGNAVARFAPQRIRIAPRSSRTIQGRTTLSEPRLWGPRPEQTPNRYVAVTTVSRGDGAGGIVDRYETPFGIRGIRCEGDSGLSVNGQHIPIRGTNNHHDLGPIGAAFNLDAARRQLETLQEMGCNALRMSHNPPAPELLDLADEMGFLVLDEVFDVWRDKKTPLDFHLIFDDWHEADLRAMIRRDRNHPSVFMWSVGNEVGEQHDGEAGAQIARRLVSIAREEDATRPITSAMNWAKPDMALPPVFDAIGLNYQGIGVRTIPGQFAPFHEKFPDKMIVSTESAAALSSRGQYQFPVPGTVSAAVRPGVGGNPDTHQVSAYELFAADFGSSADKAFSQADQHPFVAGEFVWTGWDYLGEPTPYYSSRSSYFGIIDLAGFSKDRFYLYQSRWRPDLPFVHILPHWSWPGREGEVTPVHAFSSADEAELFVNGVSQGRQERAPYQYRFRWDHVEYKPGTVKVVTYKDGRPWATGSITTAGEPARIEARVNRKLMGNGADDLAFVEAVILDDSGNRVPAASNLLDFAVGGAGELVATANGDPTDFTPFPAPQRRAFAGRALGVVRAVPGAAGAIRVDVAADGLRGGRVSLLARG